MATPIGHSLAGFVVSRFRSTHNNKIDWLFSTSMMGLAIAPDFDLIAGILQGQPALYHSGITHSFGAALFMSLIVAALLRGRGYNFWQILVYGFLAYSTHLLLDFFGPDGRPPYGIPLFWPLSDSTYLSPQPLLLGVQHVGSTSASILEFIQGVLSWRNLLAIAFELILIVPLLIVQWRFQPIRKAPSTASLEN